MKLFKRIALAAAACSLALCALTGCSGSSSAYTINGTVSLTVGGEKVITDASLVMVSDSSSIYTRYDFDGNTVEALQTGSDYYERAYATSEAATAKWTKSAAAQSTTVSSDAEAKNGTMTIDGTEYQTLTYDDVTYYCLDGNELKALYSKNGNEETLIKITSMSSEIDSSLFTAPDASMVESAS